jgi:hypothetical protein
VLKCGGASVSLSGEGSYLDTPNCDSGADKWVSQLNSGDYLVTAVDALTGASASCSFKVEEEPGIPPWVSTAAIIIGFVAAAVYVLRSLGGRSSGSSGSKDSFIGGGSRESRGSGKSNYSPSGISGYSQDSVLQKSPAPIPNIVSSTGREMQVKASDDPLVKKQEKPRFSIEDDGKAQSSSPSTRSQGSIPSQPPSPKPFAKKSDEEKSDEIPFYRVKRKNE